MLATTRAVKKHLRTLRMMFVVFILAGIPDIMSRLVPVTYWYKLESVSVEDANSFADLQVTVRREIIHAFRGYYRVYIWPEDMSAPVCIGSDELDYSVASSKVITRPASWWMANQRPLCEYAMGAGAYRMNVCINVKLPLLILAWADIKTCKWSNTFNILGNHKDHAK